ncbi:putative short-chain dehydrogenase [Thozetella sp. PMI_491]|nr:putative short-chain dehydrogenase [Thozetella sp. PMI_491]
MKNYSADTTSEEVASDCQSHIANKTILITGVSPGGLSVAFATAIAKHQPACIILSSRNSAKAEQVAQDIAATALNVRIHCISLDLSSLKSVRDAAEAINSLDEHIDVIVNSAAIMGIPYSKTADGIESHFATNYVGHFLLTNLLLPKMLATSAPLRIVNVSSTGCRFSPVRFEDTNFDDGKTYNRWVAYGQSKSAAMLFSVALARKLGGRGLVSVSLDPGIIFNTGLSAGLSFEEFGELEPLDRQMGHRSFWNFHPKPKTQSQGAATYVFAAFHPSLDEPESNGSYLADSQVVNVERVKSWARDPVDAETLWKLSEQLVSEKFAY